jgi:hypothetical protein
MRDDMGMPLPVEIGTRQDKFDAAPELLERGEWICLNVETSCAWPTRPQSTEFAGQRIWIIPITQEDHAGVAMLLPSGMDREDAEALLYRFLSVLAWRENSGIAVAHRTGGSLPYMVGLNKKHGFAIREEFDLTEAVCPTDEAPRIALALMREGRSLNHHGYAFLSFCRVLELAYPESDERIAWMTGTLPSY